MAVFRISSIQSRLVICMFYSFVCIRFCFLFNFNVISVISKYLGLKMHVFLTAFNENRHELPFPDPSLGLSAKFRP